jgi:hypothetical protein
MGYAVDINPRQLCICSTAVLHANYPAASTPNAAYTKLKEIALTFSIVPKGSVQIQFQLRCQDPFVGTSWARVYRNGVAIGTACQNTTGPVFETFAENFSFTDLKFNDLFQLYVKDTGGHTAEVQDFRFNAVLSNFYNTLE